MNSPEPARPEQAPDPSQPTRDVVVVGSSAGGIEALGLLLHVLPKDLPASLFLVQHQLPRGAGALVDILNRTSTLPVHWAEQGEAITRGRVYVGPADVHLMFSEGRVNLNRGARENFFRPSISRAFRSAAGSFGARTIGVLLTGMLDDGVSGLAAIRRAGGCVLVQDPSDAEFPEMPRQALLSGLVDRTLTLEHIAHALVELTAEVAPRVDVPDDVLAEAQIDLRSPHVEPEALSGLAPQTPIRCPECGGPTWALGDETSRTIRCYLGHAYDPRVLLDRSDAEVERALWTAVRSLHDRATTLGTLSRDAALRGHEQAAREFDLRGKEALEHATIAREFLIKLTSG